MADEPAETGDPLRPLTKEEQAELAELFLTDRAKLQAHLKELVIRNLMQVLFESDGNALRTQVETTFHRSVTAIVNEAFGVRERFSSTSENFTGPWADKVREMVHSHIATVINAAELKKTTWLAPEITRLRRQYQSKYKQSFESELDRLAYEAGREDAQKMVATVLPKRH